MKSFQIAFLGLVFVGASQASQVQSVHCFHDMRPVDGNLNEVTLTVQKDGRYTAEHRVVTAGFGSPSETKVTTIAKNLKCLFAKENPRLLECSKSSSEEGESINSGINITYSSTQGVTYTGDIATSNQYNISAYSPSLPGRRLELEIPIREGFGIPSSCDVK